MLFTGEVEDAPALIAALDVVLVPSWEEPFGRVVIEAMAMRTPVLATSVGGPADIVTDGIDGMLLPPRSPEVWGASVAELLADPERMARMGTAGRETAVRRYALPQFVANVVECYRAAIA